MNNCMLTIKNFLAYKKDFKQCKWFNKILLIWRILLQNVGGILSDNHPFVLI